MPHDCLRIIERKSKVRNSCNKPVVAKVSSSNSTLGISPDVAELKDMVKALLLEKKNQTQAPTPAKAVEESCDTCGGTHSYRNCPATDGNVYRDNIQEYVSQAATTNFNQRNTGYRAPIANQIRPLGFPPNQNQNLQNQMTNLPDMLSKFVNSNTASTLGSGTLPSNTITALKTCLYQVIEQYTARSGMDMKMAKTCYHSYCTSINVSEEQNLDLSAGTPSNLKKERIKACIKENVISGRPRYKQQCCSLILAESDSLPHAHAQTTKTYYKHQDSRIKKAQELKTKTSINSDIQDLPLRYQVYQGRLLASFQDDAKYEHVGQDTRSQDGKDNQDKQGKDLKISKQKTKSKDNDKSSRSNIT
ncbi:hypothetical protein Tco_0989592 [Tanacetum coccineum]|uniref:Reverse transcriptase domain-containing protein n=1 Tax=Tanacetum coccineum TaxID=301880 RepID=A0ABQ5EU34_9ASTR